MQEICQDKHKHTQLIKPPHVCVPPDLLHSPARVSKSGVDRAGKGHIWSWGQVRADTDKTTDKAGEEEEVIRGWGGGHHITEPRHFPGCKERISALFTLSSIPETASLFFRFPLTVADRHKPAGGDPKQTPDLHRAQAAWIC